LPPGWKNRGVQNIPRFFRMSSALHEF
jgi:hypothetical protein